MSKKTKTPSTLVAEEASRKIRYMEGSPKQYRADAKTGTFNINGRTEVGNQLMFHPIAYRYFKDNLFNRGEMEWIELFFIDEKDCLSTIMFNGYSLQNLRAFAGELFYDDVTLTDIVVEVNWEKHKNESANAIYYIASFSVVEIVSEEVKIAVQELVKNTEIYRKDTISPTCIILEQKNYRPAVNLLPEELMDNAVETDEAIEDTVTVS